MKSTSKRSSSRKKDKDIRGKGKKGTDENEKLVVGAGWTAAATQHFIELQTDEERLVHVQQMFNISDNDYKYNNRSTFIVDFHLANGVFCMEHKFDAQQMQFICRTLSQMLDMINTACSEQADPVALKNDIFNHFHTQFDEYNAEEYHFTTDQTAFVLDFVSTAIIRPIRMIVKLFSSERPVRQVYCLQKLFIPPAPIPLAEFHEEIPLVDPDLEFEPLNIPKAAGITLSDIKEIINQYTDSVIQKIEKRYDLLEERLTHLTQV